MTRTYHTAAEAISFIGVVLSMLNRLRKKHE